MKRYSVRLLWPLTLLLIVTSCASAAQLQIHHINVGQGDSTLVISPTGKTVLIDGGDNGRGTKYVLPYLQRLCVQRLDYVLVSHYDGDHIAGLDEVVNGIGITNVGMVADRGVVPPPPSTQCYKAYVKAAGGRHCSLRLGQVIDIGGGAVMKCIAQGGVVLGKPAIAKAARNENNLSVAWVLVYKGFRYYTGGDCAGDNYGEYVDVETQLKSAVGPVDAMKVNHHGSAGSSNVEFLTALNPTAAVIEVGSSKHHHPTQDALCRLQNAHCTIYATEQGNGGVLPMGIEYIANGNIKLTTDGLSTFSVVYGPGLVHTYPLRRSK